MIISHLHVWDQKNKGDHAIVLAVQELLKANFPKCRIIDFPVNVLKEGKTKEINKINQADLIVIGGGGIFYSYFLPYSLEVIKAFKKPVVIFGAGYIKEVDAPELSRAASKSIAALAEKAVALGVRDFRTKDFLIKEGIKSAKVKVIGDPAALLKELKPKNFKLNKQKIKIGFNLNYSGWLGFGKWHDDIISAYQITADYFIKKYGAAKVDFFYLQHHPGEKKIYPELKIKNLRVVNLKPANQKYVYGQLDLVVGMMLHAGVMSFGAGTPEISVAYDLRNYSFAKFISCPELVVDLDKLKKGELLKRVKLVFAKKALYRKKFAKIKGKILKEETKFLRHLA